MCIVKFYFKLRKVCNLVVAHLLMVQWVTESIPLDGPFEILIIQTSAPQLVLQTLWYVLSCLWDDAYLKLPPCY